MAEGWSFSIFVETEYGRIHKISGWEDLSVFLLCHWPVAHGAAYTAAVCGLSQSYYSKASSNHLMKIFIHALHEAELPYSFERVGGAV
ncbi:DUF982 domain-containing protein [Pseudochrobactrum sp. MP213Fo]|uniref:DUF982 domain-containing protein n=1 Tax=Pseudochrobactrum sp. MP213Fo TaxID=3022250 RepID=UPI003B9E5FD0